MTDKSCSYFFSYGTCKNYTVQTYYKIKLDKEKFRKQSKLNQQRRLETNVPLNNSFNLFTEHS